MLDKFDCAAETITGKSLVMYEQNYGEFPDRLEPKYAFDQKHRRPKDLNIVREDRKPTYGSLPTNW